MHEMSIAISMLEGVLAAGKQAGARRIEAVEIEVGAMQRVVPEALQQAWQAVCFETIADAAELTITEVPAQAECRQCGRRFEPEIEYSFLCPGCGQADVRIISGETIILKSVTCETDAETEVT